MRSYVVLVFIFFLFKNIVVAQDSVNTINVGLNKEKLAWIIGTETTLYLGSMAYLQFIWYKDHERVPFQFYNDNKGYLQIDKFGHALGAYLESYIGYYWLRSAGVSKHKALIFGGTLGLILQTPIEVWDGLYEGWGFSTGDMIANTAGSAFLIGQELLFNNQLMKYKFSFSRSKYADQANGYLGENTVQSLFYDYNGHTYWVSINADKLFLKNNLPDWLSIAVGYSANGMFGEFKNKTSYHGITIPETARYRQFLLSLDIDFTKIKTKSRFLNSVFQSMFFVKIPFPALELNSKGQLKGHLLYY